MKNLNLNTFLVLILIAGCGLPEQFQLIGEDQARRKADSHSFCAKAPCTALITHSTLDVPYLDVARNNQLRYAKKYGLDYEFRNNLISDFKNGQFINPKATKKVFQQGLYWQKLIAINEALHQKDGDRYRYEWVWWLDPDAIFSNFSISPEDFIKKYGQNAELIAAQDPFTALNAGVLFIRNSEISRRMIQEIINLYPFYMNDNLPEQTALSDYAQGFVFQNPAGGTLFTPESERNYNTSPISKVNIVKQRAMNSFYQGGLWPLAVGPAIVWEPGDFIVHFAVVKNKDLSMRALVKCFEEKCGQHYEDKGTCIEQCR